LKRPLRSSSSSSKKRDRASSQNHNSIRNSEIALSGDFKVKAIQGHH
jgi:hypothetical protein